MFFRSQEAVCAQNANGSSWTLGTLYYTKLAGFEHKSLRFSSAVVRLSVYTTPFAPFWVAGVRVHDLRLAGECAEYSRVPSQEDIGILQALELTLRLEAWLHPWVNLSPRAWAASKPPSCSCR